MVSGEASALRFPTYRLFPADPAGSPASPRSGMPDSPEAANHLIQTNRTMRTVDTLWVRRPAVAGFTMVEMLIVIAVIAVMASMVVSAFSNAAQDTRRVIARQQQAAIQSAVNSWVAANSSGNQSLGDARTAYNAAANSGARLALVGTYLDDVTLAHFTEYTTDSAKISSEALKKSGQHVELPAWAQGSYPKVDLK